MADKIEQEIGINATKALDALARLDAGFQTFEKRLDSVYQRMQAFNQMSGKTVAGMKNVSTGTQDVGSAFRQNLPKAEESVTRLTVSWQTMARIMTTQLIVRALSQMRRTFERTGEAAVKFQRQVALISTIDNSGTSLDRIGAQVRELSDAFNITLDAAGEGVYNAISNQVGDFGESLEFTAKAAQFAKATNSSLADSVDLLSAALIGYGMTTAETDRVASVFFAAIDKGRITASELANSFGRVNTIAADLGVSLEETAATLAAITVRGTKTSEALTQFRGILSSLTKPSEAMARTLRNQGFSSAQTAIQTLGLSGTLQTLRDATGGSSEALAKLFPNVRALSGAASLSSDDFESLIENTKSMDTAARDFATNKFLQATATDAEKVTREINKLKNAMTVDLGQSVLSVTADLSDFVGGADEVTKAAKAAGPALVGLGGGFIALRGSIAAARAEAVGLSRALGALALLPVAYGLGSSVGSYIGSQLSESQFADLRSIEKRNQAEIDALSQRLGTERDLLAQGDRQRVQAANELVRQLNRSYLADVDNIRSANAAMVNSAKDALGQVVSERKNAIDELRRAVTQSADIISNSQKRVADLLASREDRQFRRSIAGFDDPSQAIRLAQRAQQIAGEAATSLGQAVSPEQVSEALKLFHRAFRLASEAEGLAGGSAAASRQAAQAYEAIVDRQLAAEKQLAASQEKRQPLLDDAIRKQERVLSLLERQVEIAKETVSVFSGSSLFSDSEIEARQKRLDQALDEIKTLANVELKIDTASLVAEVREAFAELREGLPFDLSPLERFTGSPIDTPDQLSAAIAKVAERQAEIRSQIDASLVADEKRLQINQQISHLLEQLDAGAANRNLFEGHETDALRQQYETLRDLIDRVLSDGQVSAAEFDSLVDPARQFAENIREANAAARIGFRDTRLAVAELLDSMRQFAQTQPPNVSGLRAELTGLDTIMASVAQNTANTASQMERAARAASQVTGTPQGRAFGGAINYRAAGGLARGTDSVPAMLSPGEFVVNAKSANRFFGQLQAINAGMPSYREFGGTVDNSTTVGDIHVHGTRDPEITAREVIAKIKREQRRGTSRLR